MVCPLDPKARVEDNCPERTWFDALIEGWHDQASVRHVLDALHRRDLARAEKPPVLHVTMTGPLPTAGPASSFRVDPAAGTVRFTTGGSPVLPAVRDDEVETVIMPRVRLRAGGSWLP